MADRGSPGPVGVEALDRRVRRRKRRLERVNPVDEPERYLEEFTALVELEAQLRDAQDRPDERGTP